MPADKSTIKNLSKAGRLRRKIELVGLKCRLTGKNIYSQTADKVGVFIAQLLYLTT